MLNHFAIIKPKWEEAIKYPDWYLQIQEDYKCLIKRAEESDKQTSRAIKEEIYRFFEDHLEKGNIALEENGPNWDTERKPIDIIVIHHTKEPSGITWPRLSAMGLIRLYAAYYASPYYEQDFHIKGKPICSGHFREEKQVFYAYHWLVRMDGTTERLLKDSEIGWQAGDWKVNCRSVAICLDGDFENSIPSEKVLLSVANLIKKQYPQIKAENILGHREVNPKTTCPGNQSLNNGWKLKLINFIYD